MRRFLVLLTLILTVVVAGCRFKDPNVIKGGGEKITVDPVTGVVEVEGHVVNDGSARAGDVELHFSFSQQGDVYLEGMIYLGDIPAGETKDFSAAFYGPPIADPATAAFAWDYTINWD